MKVGVALIGEFRLEERLVIPWMEVPVGLGRIVDSERAAALADELAGQVPGNAWSFVARARMRGV